MSGLEADIDKQFKSLASDAEKRASAQALQSGKGSKEAFAIGRQAAKDTEQRLRGNFERTGELPLGISRDIAQLSRSPAVEEAIGRVPPPVVSVTINNQTVTLSIGEFNQEIDASSVRGGPQELGQGSQTGFLGGLEQLLGRAVQNIATPVKV